MKIGSNKLRSYVSVAVVALVALMVLVNPVAAATTILNYDTGTEFQNNVASTNGTVNYTSTGLELTEGSSVASYTSNTVSMASTDQYNLNYNFGTVNTDSVTISVYDASDDTVVAQKTASASGSGTTSFTTTASNVYVEVTIPSGSSGNTAVVDSVEVVSDPPTGSLSVDVNESDGSAPESYNGSETTVTVADPSSGETVVQKTGTTGGYDFSNLETGDYDVTVSHPDYDTVQKTVTITENSTTSSTFELSRTMGTLEITDVTRASDGTSFSYIEFDIHNASNGDLVVGQSGVSPPYTKQVWTRYDYNAEVTAYDDGWETVTKTYTISGGTTTAKSYTLEKLNSAPTADFQDSDNASTVLSGTTVTLDASASSDPDGDSLSFDWDTDGDGTFDDATGPTIDVSESSAGTYDYTVRVSDGNGATSTATYTLTVNATGTVEVTEVTNDAGETISSYDVEVIKLTSSGDPSDGTVVDTASSVSSYSSDFEVTGNGYTVNVTADGYDESSQTYTLTENTTTSKSFTVSELVTLTFHVENSQGEAVENAQVEIDYTTGGLYASTTTNADGQAVLYGVPQNDWDVSVTHSSYSTVQSSISPATDTTYDVTFGTDSDTEAIVVSDSTNTDSSTGGGFFGSNGGLFSGLSLLLLIAGVYLFYRDDDDDGRY
ncbi:carboxypeptidase regulatory-like domain-containing protein [Halogeometricum borinquense]|uniref:Carboxypeptidase regulatory-like domain-containing protein n=1 Tax=Halogeometricum borinquense TaxID=60847 RepID=A0A6C0ULJ5_9EURY|nr:carboxypeptidase-like regulatory domain-containing protein [Halogeometricum borinquense]QIB75231.1 carboxypeptidase regulatory-like domain-containing protein [Halogeometricum borinquense]